MREITQEILQVFEDLQRMKFKRQQNGAGESDKDSFGYAFEPFDAFSTEPLEFSETALRLDIEAKEMFAMIRTLNRHSPLFYKLTGQFERLVSLLGSCCITKAMIEKQEGESFELLQDLTIGSLREMAAFIFRKCTAAFMDSRACGKSNLGAFALSVRWAALDERLTATGEKIKVSKSTQSAVLSTRCELPVAGCQLPEAGEQFAVQGNEDGFDRKLPVSAFAEKGRAFPVLQGTVRADTERCRKELSAEARAVEIKDKKPEIGNDLSSQKGTKGTVFADSGSSQESCPDRPGEQIPVDGSRLPETDDNGGDSPQHHTVSPDNSPDSRQHPGHPDGEEKQFMREVLLGDALDRGDREAYEAAARVPDEGLEALWQEFLRREVRNGFPYLQKIGLIGDVPEEPPPEEAWNEEALFPEFAVT